jgi:hypothetical protein
MQWDQRLRASRAMLATSNFPPAAPSPASLSLFSEVFATSETNNYL